MGFEGWVMSDWRAAHNNKNNAAAAADGTRPPLQPGHLPRRWAVHGASYALAGTDQNMPGNDGYFSTRALAATVGSGHTRAMARRVVRGMLASGAWGARPVCVAGCDCARALYETTATTAAHQSLARHVAAASVVLLKNEGPVLPIRGAGCDRDAPSAAGGTCVASRRVVIVGSACFAPPLSAETAARDWTASDYFTVGGSGRVIAARAGPVGDALRTALTAAGADVTTAADDDASAALESMRGAAVAIACGGATGGEASDRPSLRLDQHDFLIDLGEISAAARADSAGATRAAAVAPLVVIAFAPGSVDASWADHATAAALMCPGGEASAAAWVDVLTGHVTPSAKLPVTLHSPATPETHPCTGRRCEYVEGVHVGWRALHDAPVAYPFGHGLSYTTCTYAWSQRPTPTRRLPSGPIRPADADADAAVANMSVVITNAGSTRGAEVVQLYLRFPPAAAQPPIVLRGFAKTPLLAPGAVHVARFELSARGVSTWAGGWRPVGGTFGAVVGGSSRDARLSAELRLAP